MLHFSVAQAVSAATLCAGPVLRIIALVSVAIVASVADIVVKREPPKTIGSTSSPPAPRRRGADPVRHRMSRALAV